MASQNKPPFFSVIIPTRDRPELFKLALDSVLAQDFNDFEIHVVNDGSSGKFLDLYKALEKEYAEKVTFHYLLFRPNGHGQSYSMNYGAFYAQGHYLCFLDDDDYWIDNRHLTRAANSITKANDKIDLYYTNQKAYFSDGTQQQEAVWIENVEQMLKGISSDAEGSFKVDASFLLKCVGFAHLNCSIISKKVYDNIDGMDEGIRYECDRDLYIRSLNASDNILYNPAFISKHHIPDQKQSSNMSTMISIYEKKLFQLRVYDKGILFSQHPEIISLCKVGKGFELKHISETLANEKKYRDAFYYACQALGAAPTFKWMLYTMLLFFKSNISANGLK